MGAQGIRLLFVTGNPGAGKTELVDLLERLVSDSWTVIRVDNFIPEVFRRYPGRDWESIRPHWPAVVGEGVARAITADRSVVYDGVLQSIDEVRTVARCCGLRYPGPEVALLRLRCTEDTVVSRRLMVKWDRFGVPQTRAERAEKEAVIRDHHRRYPVAEIDGAYVLDTDGLIPQEVLRAVLSWLAKRPPPAVTQGP